MKTSKQTTRVLILLGMALIMTACEPKPKTEDTGSGNAHGGGGLSETEKLIRHHIVELATVTDWETAQTKFEQNRHDIDGMTRNNLKKDYADLNNRSYCHSMDTIMDIMMKGDCGQHQLLDRLWKLRTGTDFGAIQSTLHGQVEQAYSHHKEMLDFIRNAGNRQSNITSFDVRYDRNTENKKKTEAETYLASQPSCQVVRKGLTNIKNESAFKARRKDYCEKILGLYLDRETWTYRDERTLLGLLSIAYTTEYKNDPDIAKWHTQIDQFKEEKNNQQQ